jgi:hypothetical protein
MTTLQWDQVEIAEKMLDKLQRKTKLLTLEMEQKLLVLQMKIEEMEAKVANVETE